MVEFADATSLEPTALYSPPSVPTCLYEQEQPFVRHLLDHITMAFEGRPGAIGPLHEMLCRRWVRALAALA